MQLALFGTKPGQALGVLWRGGALSMSRGFRYTLAVVVFAAALVARFVLLPTNDGLVFITFYPAVALSALLLGAGPGLLTLALCAIAANYAFMPPFLAFKIVAIEVFEVLIFVASGLIICFLADQYQRRAHDLRCLLSDSEDLYQNAPCGYHSLDSGGTVLRINDTELELLGYRRDEVVGKMNIRDLLAPTSLARFEETFPRFKQTGRVKDLEFDFRRKDGALVPIFLSATAVFDEQGRFVMSRSTVSDRAERKRAEDLQRRLARTLRLLGVCSREVVRAEAEPVLLDGVCRLIVDTGGYELAWIGVASDTDDAVQPVAHAGFAPGDGNAARFPWEPSAGSGHGPAGAALRTGLTQVQRNCQSEANPTPWRQEAIERGYQSSIALPMIGRERPIGALMIYAAEPDAFHGEELALLEELARDLTFGVQMLRTRAQHIEAEARRQAGEERLQLALTATNLGMFDFDIVRGRLECDARVRELWGVGRDDRVNYATFMAGLHPDDLAATEAAIEQSLDPAGTGEYTLEYRVLNRSDGGERYVSASGRIFFEAGRAVRSIGVVKDISLQKRLERYERERRSELDLISSQQVAAQTAAAIAHELNQPLGSVSVYSGTALQMLRRGNANPERLQQALQGAVDQAQRAGRTLHQLIAFLHKGDARLEPVDLNDVVREANAVSAQSSTRKFRPLLELDPELPKVLANRFQVQKVLVNLLTNSAQAWPDEAVANEPCVIKVRTQGVDSMAQVTVQDSGPGIDQEMVQRIFEPFFTTKAHGMGLGLTISRTIIEAHGGKLWADPRNAPGAVFHFTLPFAS